VPLEGHWERVNTPLRELSGRERHLAWAIGGLVALAALVTVMVMIVTSSPSAAPGCIRVDLPSTMGGGTPELCGGAARSFCASPVAHQRPLESTALPKCRDAGYD
jgi:hypothetical protein